MALRAFVVATLRRTAYCSLGKNCACLVELRHVHWSVQSEVPCYVSGVIAVKILYSRRMHEIAFIQQKMFILRHIKH